MALRAASEMPTLKDCNSSKTLSFTLQQKLINFSQFLTNFSLFQLHSEYRSTYRWHEYTGNSRPEVVRKPPVPNQFGKLASLSVALQISFSNPQRTPLELHVFSSKFQEVTWRNKLAQK